MDIDRKGFALVILLIAVIAISGTVGYFVFVKKTVSINQQDVPPTEQAITKPSISKNNTSNWLLYRNTKYNYSFRYPADFLIFDGIDFDLEKGTTTPPTARSDRVLLTESADKLFGTTAAMTSFSVISGPIDTRSWRQFIYSHNLSVEVRKELEKELDSSIVSEKEIIFAGEKAYEVRFWYSMDAPLSRLILISKNPFSFLIREGFHGEPWESITNSFVFD